MKDLFRFRRQHHSVGSGVATCHAPCVSEETGSQVPASVPTETVQLDHRFEHQVAGVVKAERAPLPQQILVARRVGVGLLAVQLVVMVALSIALYRRFDLTQDYAQYAQAWYAIAHGHLNPYDSVFHYPF